MHPEVHLRPLFNRWIDRVHQPEEIIIGPRSDLFQAVARHEDTVVVVGGMGAVVRSTDGGSHWQRTTLADKPFLVDVAACPDGRFYAIEQSDGLWSLQPDGSWSRQALPEMTEPQALSCDASSVLWVIVGFSTILHSVDGGANWDSWSLDEDLYLTTIQFIDRDHGVVAGEFGTVLLTADGGSTWDRASDLPDSFYPQAAYFTSPTAGWVVGLNGTIWTTADGAQTWQTMQNSNPAPLYGITGFGNSLLAVGDNGEILHHRVGDASWTPVDDNNTARGEVLNPVLMEALQKVKKEGKARFIGTTTHANEPEVIRATVEAKIYDVVLTAYNFKQDHREEVRKAVSEAAAAGVGIVAMKTQAGVYWDREKLQPINMLAALKWVLSDPNVATAIPGSTTFDQLKDDWSVVSDITLTSEELRDLRLGEQAAGLYCQQCGQCLQGYVEVGRLFAGAIERAYLARTGKKLKERSKQIGYETRCAPPVVFDVLLGSQLGVGAYRALVEEGLSGVMVSVQDVYNLAYRPFDTLVDPETMKTKLRFIQAGSDFQKLGRALECRPAR